MHDLIKTFKENAEFSGSTVEIINLSDLASILSAKIGDEKCVLTSLNDKTLLKYLPGNINFNITPSNEELANTATSLTDSICGIAETGSILLNNDEDYKSYYSMLTRNHIVLLNSKDLCEKPRDVFKLNGIEENSSITIITGPSATADMGSLVRGVHGPEHLTILLVNDNE